MCSLAVALLMAKFNPAEIAQEEATDYALVPRVESRLAALFEHEQTWSFYAFVQCMQMCGVCGLHITQLLQGYTQGFFIAFCTSACVELLFLTLLCIIIQKVEELDTIALKMNYKNKYSNTMLLIWLALFLQSTIPLYFKCIITRLHVVTVKTFGATHAVVCLLSIFRNVMAGHAFERYPSRFSLLVGVPATLLVPTIATIISIAMVREFRFGEHDSEAGQKISMDLEMDNLNEFEDLDEGDLENLERVKLQAEKIDNALGDTS